MGFGSDLPAMIDGEPRCKFPYLVSYAYLRKEDDAQVERILGDDRREVLLDSGAFTAFNAGKEIELDEYIGFLKKWGSRLFGYMLLDKLQDPEQTERNWQRMLAEGLTPVPIHVFGEGVEQMDTFFGRSPFVALGGLRRPHRGAAPEEYVKQKMTWAAGRPVHWLGYTNEKMIRGFRPFSCDCASAWSSTQYGRVSVYLGSGRWWEGSHEEFKKVDAPTRKALRVALLAYEVDPDALNDPIAWRWSPSDRSETQANAEGRNKLYKGLPNKTTSHMTAIVSIRSYVRYIFDIRRMFGTRMFLACGSEERHDRIVDGAMEVAHLRGWDAPLEAS